MLAAFFSQTGVTDAQQENCPVLVTRASFQISSDNQWSFRASWYANPKCKVEVLDEMQKTVYGSEVCKSLDWELRTVIICFCTTAIHCNLFTHKPDLHCNASNECRILCTAIGPANGWCLVPLSIRPRCEGKDMSNDIFVYRTACSACQERTSETFSCGYQVRLCIWWSVCMYGALVWEDAVHYKIVRNIGEKVSYRQPRAVCAGFSYVRKWQNTRELLKISGFQFADILNHHNIVHYLFMRFGTKCPHKCSLGKTTWKWY